MKTSFDKHWYHIEGDKVASLLGVAPDRGLDELEIEQRLKRFGENVITGKRGKSAFERFLIQFHQPLVYILIISGVITAFLRAWVDSSVIFGIVIINAVVGYLQEDKAVRALELLSSSMSDKAMVFRNGVSLVVSAAQLVPGDIVLLRSGDKVPADIRLLVGELRIDESSLTGESVPVDKKNTILPEATLLAERLNMVYAGTLVSFGSGRGVVVATGSETELGRISGLIEGAEELETPLTRKISGFSQRLLVVILLMAVASFVIGVVRSEPMDEMFMAAVALAVGAIPEGLPAAVTIILAMGVSRMAERKAIIRKLPAVETLGSTTVICSDKTGTLTENQMTVQNVYSGGSMYSVSGVGYGSQGQIHPMENGAEVSDNRALAECLRAGLLCNNANVVVKEGRHVVEGDPTEGALIVSAAKLGLQRVEEVALHPRIDEQPFESEWRSMTTLHEHAQGRVVYMKGAVERVLECCAGAVLSSGQIGELNADEVISHQNEMASKGLRVLAVAQKRVGPDEGFGSPSCLGMNFLGLQGMIDPPREEAKAAVAACQNAGVAVKMITGDHVLTAQAIGIMLGLDGGQCAPGSDCSVMTGEDLAGLSDVELADRVGSVPIFARVSPEQKFRLVMALQKRGEVCAMTGDGVNDAPALKQSDIGVAMGINGTEVAKDAADMVLTDDNFATIEAAVEEGRGVFDNLVKFIAWTLPTNAGEGLVIMTAIFFGAALPILPVQILWMNMTTAGCMGMTLAFEPNEPDIMNRPPRTPNRPILDGIVWRRIGIVSVLLLVCSFGLFKWELLNGASIEKARTMAVNVFVMIEAFYLFNARSFRRSPFELGLTTNLWVFAGFAVMMVFQLLFTYVPVMNSLFASAPIGLLDWAKIVACGVGVYALVELDKKLTKSLSET